VRSPPTAPFLALQTSSPRSFSLKSRVCLITGGATGIGYQVARAFAEAGGDIVLGYNSSGDAAHKCVEELRKDFGVRAEAYQIPVTDPDAVEEAVKRVEKEFGKLDVVGRRFYVWRGGMD
jgi:sorbose reductase